MNYMNTSSPNDDYENSDYETDGYENREKSFNLNHKSNNRENSYPQTHRKFDVVDDGENLVYSQFMNDKFQNEDFGFMDSVALCSNNSVNGGTTNNGQKPFESGEWICKDLDTAQDWANKIRMVKPYYSGYNRSGFVGTMINLFKNELFDFNEFMHKLRVQPTAMVDCANRDQYKTLIEDIYNYKSRNKISLRY